MPTLNVVLPYIKRRLAKAADRALEVESEKTWPNCVVGQCYVF